MTSKVDSTPYSALADDKDAIRIQLNTPLATMDNSPSKRGPDMERKPLLGSLWMVGFAFFFSFTSAFTKLLYDWNPTMSSIEIIFHRCNI